MIVAIPALMIAIFAPFAGQIIDRTGRKTLLVVAMFAYAVAGTVPAWLDNLTGILISRAFVGLFEAAIMTVCTTLIVDYFHEENRRNRYLSLQTGSATTLGATVFIAVGGAVGSAASAGALLDLHNAIAIPIAVAMVFSLWEPGRGDSTDLHVPTGEKARVPWRILGLPLVVTLFGGFTFYVTNHRGQLPRRGHGRRRRRHGHDRPGRGDRIARHRRRRLHVPPHREGGHAAPAAAGVRAPGRRHDHRVALRRLRRGADRRDRRGLRLRHPAPLARHVGRLADPVRGARPRDRLVDRRVLLRAVRHAPDHGRAHRRAPGRRCPSP